MKRLPVTLIVALLGPLSGAALPGAAQATAPPAPTPSTTPATPVVVPPELQALEQKMLALQVNSERFTASISIAAPPKAQGPLGGFEHIFGRSSAAKALQTVPLLTAAGEASFVPQAANIEVSFLGLKLDARLIGTTTYVQEPFIAKLDGGRPWVVEQNKSLEQAVGLEAAPGGSGGGPTSGFRQVIETVARARSVEEVGPATVDGQATKEFRLSIARTSLTNSDGRKQSRAQERALRKLFQPLARVELFVAEDGLPVRTRFVFGLRHGGAELITQSDVLAVGVPVVVQPPPPAETISAAELKRLLARRVKRIVKRHARGKHRVVVHRTGRAPAPTPKK